MAKRFLDNKLKHSIVYWGSPINDGVGGYTYANAIETLGRWEDKKSLVKSASGEQKVSRAIVFLKIDVVVNGNLYLGTLTELAAEVGVLGVDVIPIEESASGAVIALTESADSGAVVPINRAKVINAQDIRDAKKILKFSKTRSRDGRSYLKKVWIR